MEGHDDNDPFDGLLDLEDQYYNEGYALGVSDGEKAGRAEGRLFGLEKGFGKFSEMGDLNGRSSFMLANHHLHPRAPGQFRDTADVCGIDDQLQRLLAFVNKSNLPMLIHEDLPMNDRQAKQIEALFDLTDPATLSSVNTEDAVADFDDRFRRAKAKAMLIDRSLGTVTSTSIPSDETDESTDRSRSIRITKEDKNSTQRNIEDFGRT